MIHLNQPQIFGLLLGAVFVLVWFVAMRPIALGGGTSYIKVAGNSMEPTFYGGDLVVVKQRSEYQVGDVIAYPVASGIVIHRITGGDAITGFETQGDNRPVSDAWRPKPETIVGSQVIQVPKAGTVTDLLQNPPILAGAAAVSVAWLFSGPEQRSRRKRS